MMMCFTSTLKSITVTISLTAEELIGSHGGAGGNQQYPFIIYPSEWSLEEEIFGSENVYKFFKNEMEKSWNEK